MARKPSQFIRELWREPLLHFALLGAALFVLHARAQRGTPAPAPRQVEVTQGVVRQLAQQWQSQWQRPPTQEEMQNLVKAYVREEVFRREAVDLGLDRDDTIVRRRLAQKFEFIIQDTTSPPDPTDAEIAAYYESHRDRYTTPSRVRYSQVYFSSERGAGAYSQAQAALAKLLAGDANVQVGGPSLVDSGATELSEEDLHREFGRAFCDAVKGLPLNQWRGPIESAYGWHLIRVAGRTEPAPLELGKARDLVRRDWREDRRRLANEQTFERVMAQYKVVIEPPANAPASPSSTSTPTPSPSAQTSQPRPDARPAVSVETVEVGS